MPAKRIVSIGWCLIALIVAAGTSAAQATASAPKPTAAKSGAATIYFFRTRGLVPSVTFDINVDGHKVGALAPGTYFVVKRPPGRHTLEFPAGVLRGAWQSDVEVAAGRTYYVAIGPTLTGAVGVDFLAIVLAGRHGQELPGHGLFPSSYRAEIAKLAKPGR